MSGGIILRMSDAETVKFLEYYRNEPALWDPTNDGYKKRNTRAAAAKRVAEALNLKDFTASHVITKFKNLRSSYAQELKKIAASTKSGMATQEIYVPKVVWFKEMDAFLRPHVKSRATQSNLSSRFRASQESMDINLDDDEAENQLSKSQPQELDVVTASSSHSGTSTEQHTSSTQKTKNFTELQSPNSVRSVSEAKSKSATSFCNSETPSKRPTLTKKRHVETENLTPEVLVSAMDKLEKISERATVKTEDSFDHFEKYIASLLRSLPIQQALLLQQEMISRVLNACHVSRSTAASSLSPTPSNDQAQSEDVFSPQSEDTWISDLATAMDIYNN